MVKYYWLFGGIAGLTSVLLEYLLFGGHIGYDKTYSVLLGKFLALLICIVFAVILIKKMRGGISFLRTTFTGLMIALIASSISTAGFASMSYPDGEFFTPVKEYVIKTWKENNADNLEELKKEDELIEKVEDNFKVRTHTFFDLISFVIAGLFFSALTAAFVARKSSLAG